MSLRFTEAEYEKLMANWKTIRPLSPKIAGKAPNLTVVGKPEQPEGKDATVIKKSSQTANMEQIVTKRPKYGNHKVIIDGIVFDSVKESVRYQELKLLEQTGAIRELELQKIFVLAPAVILHGRKKPALRYVADFTYSDVGGKQIVEDVKSWITKKNPAYRIKIHLMKSVLGLDVEEI